MRLFISVLFIFSAVAAFAQKGQPRLLKPLEKKVVALSATFDQIDPARKESLHAIGEYLAGEILAGKPAQALFVCTHNSRRSQISQAWAEAGAFYYGFDLTAYSGGTEATAFHPNSRAALKRAGFRLTLSGDQNAKNPDVLVEFSPSVAGLMFNSKRYSDAGAQKGAFAAVMVCSEADRSCPIVEGAGFRMALPFEDPKHADGTPAQDATYDATVDLIGREVLYLMSDVKRRLVAAKEASAGN